MLCVVPFIFSLFLRYRLVVWSEGTGLVLRIDNRSTRKVDGNNGRESEKVLVLVLWVLSLGSSVLCSPQTVCNVEQR